MHKSKNCKERSNLLFGFKKLETKSYFDNFLQPEKKIP
jgi:Holliday junction resolvasome RuvABC DNA-binding subunit